MFTRTDCAGGEGGARRGIEAVRVSGAGGGGVRPIGWLLPCAVAVARPMERGPRGGNPRSNRFPLIENSCWARPRNSAASTGFPHQPDGDRRRCGKRAKNRIPPRAAATQHTDARARACAPRRVIYHSYVTTLHT